MTSLRKAWSPPGRLRVDLDGNWTNLEGEMDGHLALVRVNEGLQSVVGHPAYDHRVVVSIRFNTRRDDGMPTTKAEVDTIDQIADEYRMALQIDQESLLAVMVTTHGRRDLIFYTCSPQQAIHKFENDLRPRAKTHRIEFLVDSDAKWELYRDFRSP